MSVTEIATAFVVNPATMERRITRAKLRISAADTAFDTPGLGERGRRLKSVMLMIYLMFNEGWSGKEGAQNRRWVLCFEAIRLLRLLLDLFPGHKELQGLLAMCLSHYARRDSRFLDDGTPQTLEHQNRSLWDTQMIAEANHLLKRALLQGHPGPYQIKAALVLVHANSTNYTQTDWAEVDRLYLSLMIFEPTPVVRLNHAISLGMLHGPKLALEKLGLLSGDLQSYRWFHTARAGLLLEDGQPRIAEMAYERAIQLGPTQAEQSAIEEKILICQKAYS